MKMKMKLRLPIDYVSWPLRNLLLMNGKKLLIFQLLFLCVFHYIILMCAPQ
jgi:hypothetical protein